MSVAPVPVIVKPPGYLVNVHVPGGNPPKTKLPILSPQAGCETELTEGGDCDDKGWVLI